MFFTKAVLEVYRDARYLNGKRGAQMQTCLNIFPVNWIGEEIQREL